MAPRAPGTQSLLAGAARLRAWFHERRSWCPIHLTISSSLFGAECAFTNSGLAVRPNGDQAYICLAPTSPLTDVSITVTVQQTSGPPTHAFGFAFRHAAPKSYYFFGIDGRGRFTFTTVVNDVSHTVIPFTPKAAIHTGANARNQLQVIARGQVITLLVNGTPVGQATLSTFASGIVGLRGINDGEVVFQQLSIAPVWMSMQPEAALP